MIRMIKNKLATILIDSGLYDETSFYSQFVNDLKHAQNDVIIESPYLTVKRATELAKLCKKLTRRGVAVRINTRQPKHHTYDLQQQALISIEILKAAGVRVFVCSDYRHRKVAVIDNRILWEGSLNILSQSKSREVMRRIESEYLASQMTLFTGLRRIY